MVTAGGNMAFHHVVQAITSAGDEIILNTPYYFNHEMAIRMLDCVPVCVATDDRYQLRVDALRALPDAVPLIYYVNGGSHLLPGMNELPVDVLSVDWRQPLSKVREIVGSRTLQGNFDPAALLAPIPEIERRVAAVIEEGKGGAHIVNLGHGILPMTPVEHVQALARHVHSVTRAR